MTIMVNEQLSFIPIPGKEKGHGNKKRRWENAFQRWSNKQLQDGHNSYGCCGYGSMCDFCVDNTYGRPCVRALNAMCRDKRLSINYDDIDFETVWRGEFGRSDGISIKSF